jgi:Protein of unknown function (DUF974)
MRLRKPNLVPQILPTITSSSLAAASPLSCLKDSSIIDPSLEGNGLTGLAALPNGFGSMFVGTTFLAYVCLNNESDQDVTQVQVTAEVRTPTSKTVLTPTSTRLGMNGLTTDDTFTLNPGEGLHQILNHSPLFSNKAKYRSNSWWRTYFGSRSDLFST